MTSSDAKTNILFVSRACKPDAGGMERLSFELLAGLARSSAINVTSIIHPGSRATSPLFVFTSLLPALRAAKDADIVYLGDPMLSLIGWLCKMVRGKPVAVTVHGLDITYPNPLYQLYLKLFFRHFDTYLPISRYVAEVLRQKHAPTGTITVINPGIHDAYYDPSVTRQAASTLLKTDPENNIVLYTNGRLTRRKGHAWFVHEVLPHLPQSVVYVISGAGQEAKSILHAAKEAGVQSRVIVTGRLADSDVKILYNTCDAFIQPNISVPNDTEGFGLVVLEAASCGKPVLAADIEGLRDAITENKNGRLLPAGDAKQWIRALDEWLQHPTILSTARHYTLEKFSWDKVIPQYKSALLSHH